MPGLVQQVCEEARPACLQLKPVMCEALIILDGTSTSGLSRLCSLNCTNARPDCCRWLDAARYGKLHTMKALVNARSKGNCQAALVAYSGQGTSYGLMGHTALHWAAAKVTTLLTKLLTSINTFQVTSHPLRVLDCISCFAVSWCTEFWT